VIRTLVAFARLARPAFLVGGFTGFALGAAVARFDGFALDPRAYAIGQALVTAYHLMVHFANDYFDQETDAITERTAWSGGSGVLPSGELPPWTALAASLACGAIGVALTVVVAFAGNPLLAAIGVAIAVCAWAYSAPPLRLLARGLGELDTIVVVAILVPLAGYASFAPELDARALLVTLPGACAMFAMMLTVEIPDRRADAATGKRNLVVRWGVARAVAVARTLAATAAVALAAVGAAAFAPPALAVLAAVPVAVLAGAYASVERLRWLPFVSAELLGVGLYATTTLAAIALVAIA
jgi:1,4-dihydroxy-2-naphthoate octaprenyltransferase